MRPTEGVWRGAEVLGRMQARDQDGEDEQMTDADLIEDVDLESATKPSDLVIKRTRRTLADAIRKKRVRKREASVPLRSEVRLSSPDPSDIILCSLLTVSSGSSPSSSGQDRALSGPGTELQAPC